jgi:hypothetical protein
MNELDVGGCCYIDPAPASPEIIVSEVQQMNGGAAISVIIVTCSAELGVDAVIDIGVAIIVIAS